MSHRTDRELVTLARSGDKRAFGALIDRYQSMVFAIAKKMVANSDSAKDLAQEAFLQAYLSLDRLRDVNRFSSWLYGIVLNVCRSYLRSQKTDFFSVEAIAGGLHFDAIPFKLLRQIRRSLLKNKNFMSWFLKLLTIYLQKTDCNVAILPKTVDFARDFCPIRYLSYGG